MLNIIVKECLELNVTDTKLITFIKDNLIIDNPDYIKLIRLKKWVGKTPAKLYLYEQNENTFILPYGFKHRLERFLQANDIKYQLIDMTATKGLKMFKTNNLSLYDYQEQAVEQVLKHTNGILVSPAGSGKTRMAMKLIGELNQKTLWLTNNLSLLTQSKNVFKQFYGNKVGEISGGKVNIQDITFATVQTMANLDLTKYKHEFGLVITDEAHRVIGSPTKMQQFFKVINSLNAKYKYGLTATLFEKKNDMSMCPIFLIGEKLHEVRTENVEKILAKHELYKLDTPFSYDILNADRTIDYNKLLDYLVTNPERNTQIMINLFYCQDKHNIILTSRNEHLNILSEYLNSFDIPHHIVIGDTKSKDREQMFEDFKQGKVRFLLSNYQLAKEGLDLPIADTLHLVTPIRDKRSIIQSAGRVERKHAGKTESKVYDYVDVEFPMLVNMYKDRKRYLNAR